MKFNLDKVVGDKLIHFFELSPSAFCPLSLLVQDNFPEKVLLCMKLSVQKRTSRILHSMYYLEYNHDSK